MGLDVDSRRHHSVSSLLHEMCDPEPANKLLPFNSDFEYFEIGKEEEIREVNK